MHSIVQICNQALLHIGTRPIASLDEPTPEATYCKQFFDQAVLSVLADHPWGFAQRREELAEAPLPAGWRSSYDRAYAYPLDCLQSHYLMSNCGSDRTQAYELAADTDRTIVLTNLEGAIMAYTAYIQDVTRFSPKFTDALGRKLQCLLAKPILKSGARAVQEAEELYVRALAEAKTADSKEGRPFNDPEMPWLAGNLWVDDRMGLFRVI